MKKIQKNPQVHTKQYIKIFFWFFMGALLGLFFFSSFLFILFQKRYANTMYPGVTIDNIDVSGKTQEEIKSYFRRKNAAISTSSFTFNVQDQTATMSAEQLKIGYDENLLSKQAYSIGRSEDIFSNVSLITQAYVKGINLPAVYHYDETMLENTILPLADSIKITPVDALFTFENGKVTAFQPSVDGKDIDLTQLKKTVGRLIPSLLGSNQQQIIRIDVPITTIRPDITTDEANNFGIKELIASGTSKYPGSIESRIYNISLAASRINGVLVKPSEVFSFNKVLGDISAATGYKQAYIIQNGKTILGDGGGVCQVSTTFFRALLNAGLPIVERNQHAYRVRYYEEDSGPGLDAAIFTPDVDLKFKNDTGHYILIQNVNNVENHQLTFFLYGTKDNREVTLGKPVIVSQTPAPEPLYQDDPTLPKGTIKQVDYAAVGAKVYFTREVMKDGKNILSEKFTSNFRPWRAVFLRGTKE